MTREIVLDTETTGIDPKDGHRIIEIGALEMDNHMPTGNQLHLYINPERDIDAWRGGDSRSDHRVPGRQACICRYCR
jgi:hypothetical protein